MKNTVFTLLLSLLTVQAFAQKQVIKDSISLGAPIVQQVARPFITDSISLGAPSGGFQYPNDVYYNMQTGAKTTVVGHNWHLAFALRKAIPPMRFLQSATILANEGRGVTVFQSPHTWNNFDTTGHRSWSNPHNSDSTWDIGALNGGLNMQQFNFGWGVYNQQTHDITGNTVYLVRITVGSGQTAVNTYKKLTISSLSQDSIWTFSYANVDNSDSTAVSIDKSKYTNKLFAYHNLINDSTYNREPNTKWDILFTRYGAFYTQFGQTIFSSNTGVLSHPSLLVSKVVGTSVNNAIPGTYSNHITAIGTDWKENPGPGQPNFLVKDSITYFTKDLVNTEFKMAFTSFRGSSTGVIVFRRASTTPNTITLENYPNDVFYNMESGTVSTAKGSNWHLAFAIRNAAPPMNVMRSTTILANEGRGVSVFVSPQAIGNWSSFDTTGFRTWNNPHNSDSTWDIGALNVYRDSSDGFDFGWGKYDVVSHDLEATRMFLVRITYGTGVATTNTFKKIKIDRLAFDTQWVFTYANIDGSNSKTIIFNKSQFAGKLFAYHNLINDTTYDREPNTRWDLLFTRFGDYYTQFGQTIFSSNTGALSHPTLMTSRVAGVPTDSAVAGVYTNRITGIGTDWKQNPGPGQPNFRVYDSLSYFTKRTNGREDKLVFEAFRGASNGVIVFNKTNLMLGTGLAKNSAIQSIHVFPNPASTVVQIQITSKAQSASVKLFDVTGRELQTVQLNTLSSNRFEGAIAIDGLTKGIYFIKITSGDASQTKRIIVN